MRVKIEFLKDEAESNLSASVETQHKRGETFTIHTAVALANGESSTFTVPASGRLVINMPTATEKPVYDREQAAAVYPSAQVQGNEGADRPNMTEIISAKERELRDLREAENARVRRAEDEEKARLAQENERNLKEKEDQERARLAAARTGAPSTPPIRTPMTGGQPLAGKTPASTTANASKTTPNPSPGTQPSNPATNQSSGGNTEKK